MSSDAILLAVIAIGIGTFVLRVSFIELAGRMPLPPRLSRALRFLPAAVLSAIILPAVLKLPDGTLDFTPTNPKIIAALDATLIAWRTKSSTFTVFGAMALFWWLRWLGGKEARASPARLTHGTAQQPCAFLRAGALPLDPAAYLRPISLAHLVYLCLHRM